MKSGSWLGVQVVLAIAGLSLKRRLAPCGFERVTGEMAGFCASSEFLFNW